MERLKRVKIKSKILYLLVVLLALSTLFFYSKYIVLKKNTNYAFRMSRSISFANQINDTDLIAEISILKDKAYLERILNEIETKGNSGYSLDNYIAIKYKNGNTLMVQTTQNKEGIFLIKDMFFLDEESYERLIYSRDIPN